MKSKPKLTGTTHTLPFDKLDPLSFERLCLWLVRAEGYSREEHYGLSGSDHGRDIVAYKPGSGDEQLWYFQCKRYRTISYTMLKADLDKISELGKERPDLWPTGIVFVINCAVSAKVRDDINRYAHSIGLACEFWAHTELDLRVKKHPEIVEEFFQLKSDEEPGTCNLSLSSGIIHAMPPAPMFVGREKELKALHDFWISGKRGVFSLVGLGGAGKTAIVVEFLNQLLKKDDNAPNGLFVWSFYFDQDADTFLRTAYRYFSGGQETDARGGGLLYLLIECLQVGGRYLIVMDGLERVQHSHSDQEGMFGELEDPLLRQIVSRLAIGIGQTACLITSRIMIADLHPWQGQGYWPLDLDQLKHDDARTLLRLHKIKGDEVILDRIIDEYGAHALTLDYFCTYIAKYCKGDPTKAAELEEPRILSEEQAERRLVKVFQAYEKALSDKELALLSRLCIFRFSITIETLYGIFSKKGNEKVTGPLAGLTKTEFQHIINHLVNLHLLVKESAEYYTAHPAVRDYFYGILSKPSSLHNAICHHILTLTKQPGISYPMDKETLDLLEELIYHAINAGRINEAVHIYNKRMGGRKHLAWQLGEYNRGLRILRAFPTCPDNKGLHWYLRALGKLPEVIQNNLKVYNYQSSEIVCLQGKLPQILGLKNERVSIRVKHIAKFLMGDRSAQDPKYFKRMASVPLNTPDFYIYLGDLKSARSAAEKLIRSYWRENWLDAFSQMVLTQAEIERQEGNLVECQAKIREVSEWILRSGSQEHLCLLHLTTGRLALDERQYGKSQAALTEGLHIAEQCGFGLYYIDLMNEQSRLYLLKGKPKKAQDAALIALNGILKNIRKPPERSNFPEYQLAMLGAKHPKCQYAWAEAEAKHLLGEALLAQRRTGEACIILQETLRLRQRIGDPKANRTQKLLKLIEG